MVSGLIAEVCTVARGQIPWLQISHIRDFDFLLRIQPKPEPFKLVSFSVNALVSSV